MKTYIISRERKNEIKDIVLAILKKAGINSLPVDIGAIARAHNIDCIKADAVMARGIDMRTASFDGMAIKSGERYYIFYNPEAIAARVRYTLTCQLAHIFLGHLTGAADNEAASLEARYFADELLMPLPVLDSYGCRTGAEIAEKCEVSMSAGEIRSRDFERRDRYKKQNGETEYDMKFLNVFFGHK